MNATLPAPPPVSPAARLFVGPEIAFAGWWRRVGAWAIDAAILGISSNMVFAFVGVSGSSVVIAIALVVASIGALVYHVMLNSHGNQTIGRKVLGTRVVREGGGDLSYSVAALRFLVTTLSWLPLLLGMLWPLWDDKKQTFHDKIALTVVIET